MIEDIQLNEIKSITTTNKIIFYSNYIRNSENPDGLYT